MVRVKVRYVIQSKLTWSILLTHKRLQIELLCPTERAYTLLAPRDATQELTVVHAVLCMSTKFTFHIIASSATYRYMSDVIPNNRVTNLKFLTIFSALLSSSSRERPKFPNPPPPTRSAKLTHRTRNDISPPAPPPHCSRAMTPNLSRPSHSILQLHL